MLALGCFYIAIGTAMTTGGLAGLRYAWRVQHGNGWWAPSTDAAWQLMQRRVIGPDTDPFMVRYTLLGTPFVDIKIHHQYRHDLASDLHTHPWWMFALVLYGGYVEQRPGVLADNPRLNGPRRHVCRRPGNLYFMRYGAAHRIDRLRYHDVGSWSLAITGHNHGDWGFQLDDGTWVNEQTYFATHR